MTAPIKVGDRVAVIAKGPFQCRVGEVEITSTTEARVDLGGQSMWFRTHEIARLTEPPEEGRERVGEALTAERPPREEGAQAPPVTAPLKVGDRVLVIAKITERKEESK